MTARKLKTGWTTGACATAATRAACMALCTGSFPREVEITLPSGRTPIFALSLCELGEGWARAGVIKDAGDDPDVTHGVTVIATLSRGAGGQGVVFRAGKGVGVITKDGLPLAPGEPAINPAPRQMMQQTIAELCRKYGQKEDFVLEISIPNGVVLARKTWNPRLGIIGGLSVLGTSGIVIPYSCSAWIHSIHRGIDVARANGISHIAGSTGDSAEKGVQKYHNLPLFALIDMGNFVGGMLKYLRRHPVGRVTIAGGFGKMVKLSQGALDLHSSRCQACFVSLGAILRKLGADPKLCQQVENANTAAQILGLAQQNNLPLAQIVAQNAWHIAQKTMRGGEIEIDVVIVDRQAKIVAQANHKTANHDTVNHGAVNQCTVNHG